MGQRGLENGPACAAQGVEHLVGEVGVDQNEQGGRAGRQLFSKLLHEIVVDAHVAQRTGDGTGSCSDHEAEQRIHEDQADEHAPETAADSAAGGQVVHLVQLHLAVLFFFNNHGVLKGNQIRLLHFQELKAHFLGLEFRIVCHSNQFTHGKTS